MANGIVADVAVIGSGITAAAIGYALARRGLQTFVALEARVNNPGTAGRAFGVVRTYHADPVMISLARRSLRFYERFEEETQRRVVFTRGGLLVLVPMGEQEALARHVNDANKRGSSLRLLPASADVLAIEPRLALPGVGAAAYEANALYGNPTQVAEEFINAARLHGAKVVEGIHVLKVELTGRPGNYAIAGLLTDGGHVKTRYIVNAGGARANELNAMVGVHLPLAPLHAIGMIVRHPVTFAGPPLPIMFDLASGIALRPNGPGQTLMGPLLSVAEDLVVPDAPAPPLTPPNNKEYLRLLSRRFPTLGTARVSDVWTASHDLSPDRRPIIGAIPGVGGYYCAVGMGGHSFGLAPAVGELIAREITEPRADSLGDNVPPRLRTQEVRNNAYMFRPERYPLTLPPPENHLPADR